MTTDFLNHPNPRFLYLAELHHPFPDWVANQPIPDKSEFEKQASAAFADPARRLLPISTKAATFHSALNIYAQMDEFDEVIFDRVKKACEVFELDDDLEPYVDLFAGVWEKSAAENDQSVFAIDTEMGGERFQLLPINTAQEIDSSAHDLAKMAADNRIHILMLVPAAKEIVKAAADAGVTALPSLITRLGNERFPDVTKTKDLLAGREKYAKVADIDPDILAQEYTSVVDMIPDSPYEAFEKLAALDRQAGVRCDYRPSAVIPTAYETVFCGQLVAEVEKVASEHVVINDVMIPLQAIKDINLLRASFTLTKEAGESFKDVVRSDDAKDISVAVEEWGDADKRSLMSLAAST